MHNATDTATVLGTVVSESQVTREVVTCTPMVPKELTVVTSSMGYYDIENGGREFLGMWLEVAALNAYVIQRNGYLAERKKHDYLQFCVTLAEELIRSFST